MSVVPPSLSLTVNSARRACVIDMPLALSQFGLLLTQRLSDEFNLWLVRELWQILDSPEYFQSHPELLVATHSPANAHRVRAKIRKSFLQQTLEQWQFVRMQSDLGGMRVYWLNDALPDSLLPQDADAHLIDRFESLAVALEKRGGESNPGNSEYDAASQCHLEAAALSAALIPCKGFILTEGGDKATGGEPLLCGFLRQHGIGCIHVETAAATQAERSFFSPIISRAGLSELFWAGLRLVAVHLFVPRAIVMPVIKAGETSLVHKGFQLEGVEKAEPTDWWEDAKCFWHALHR
jgi:hypothetical protein